MSLNIKNETVHELAREAARVSGLSQTSAIEQALRQFLRDRGIDPEEQDRERRRARLLAMGTRFHAEEATPGGGVVRIDDLYDEETGLPL